MGFKGMALRTSLRARQFGLFRDSVNFLPVVLAKPVGRVLAEQPGQTSLEGQREHAAAVDAADETAAEVLSRTRVAHLH